MKAQVAGVAVMALAVLGAGLLALSGCDGCSRETLPGGAATTSEAPNATAGDSYADTAQRQDEASPPAPPPATPEQAAAQAASSFVLGLWDQGQRPAGQLQYPLHLDGKLVGTEAQYAAWVDRRKRRRDRKDLEVTIRGTRQGEVQSASEQELRASTGFTAKDDGARAFLAHGQSRPGAWMVRVDIMATRGKATIVDLAYVLVAPLPASGGQFAILGYRE